MMQQGPKSEMELKFDKINRTTSYAAKRNLIEQLTDDERAIYNKQQEKKAEYNECMPTPVPFTPARIKATSTARKGVVIKNAPTIENNIESSNKPKQKLTQ